MVSFDRFSQWLSVFESALAARQLDLYPDTGRLHSACRYALAGQGKRIRPLLAMASAEACGADWQTAIPAGLALEFIHTYSLVHDDLPCMDNDDLRRGRATTHKVYDEATALLVGDALLTDSFQLLFDASFLPATCQLQLVRVLSRAAGGCAMVFGQDLDMHWTARSGYTEQDLDAIHSHKTAALIAASCVMGGISAQAPEEALQALQTFGESIGLSFQIIDDLLDGSTQTGKSQGKDQQSGKLTYLSLMSREEALLRSQILTDKAMKSLDIFGGKAASLRFLADLLLQRQS